MNWLTDCIIRIKNAGAIAKTSVEVRGSKVCLKILEVLKNEGFIVDFVIKEETERGLKQACNVVLSYYKDIPLIKNVKFVSTPKNRIHKKCEELKKYMHDFKFCVVSTNKGIMSCKDAIESNLGGEVLFWIWS